MKHSLDIGIILCDRDFENFCKIIKVLQKYKFYKNILVFDNCETKTIPKKLLKNKRIKYFTEHQNMFQFFGRSVIASNASSDYIWFIDSDDFPVLNAKSIRAIKRQLKKELVSMIRFSYTSTERPFSIINFFEKDNEMYLGFALWNKFLCSSDLKKFFGLARIGKQVFHEDTLILKYLYNLPTYKARYDEAVIYSYNDTNAMYCKKTHTKEELMELFTGLDLYKENLKILGLKDEFLEKSIRDIQETANDDE